MKPSDTATQASLESIGCPEANVTSRSKPSLAGRLGQVEILVALLNARLQGLCAAEDRLRDEGKAPVCAVCIDGERRLEGLLGRQAADHHIVLALIECGQTGAGGSHLAGKLRSLRPHPSWTDAKREGYSVASRDALHALRRECARRGRR